MYLKKRRQTGGVFRGSNRQRGNQDGGVFRGKNRQRGSKKKQRGGIFTYNMVRKIRRRKQRGGSTYWNGKPGTKPWTGFKQFGGGIKPYLGRHENVETMIHM